MAPINEVREADTVARLGGDEFILLLDGIDEDAATQHVAEKVLAALAQPIPYRGVSRKAKIRQVRVFEKSALVKQLSNRAFE